MGFFNDIFETRFLKKIFQENTESGTSEWEDSEWEETALVNQISKRLNCFKRFYLFNF